MQAKNACAVLTRDTSNHQQKRIFPCAIKVLQQLALTYHQHDFASLLSAINHVDMSANNNLHSTSEESKAQEENEEEEETYDDNTSEQEDDHVDDDSEEIPELVPRDESISNSGDDTENETDEDT